MICLSFGTESTGYVCTHNSAFSTFRSTNTFLLLRSFIQLICGKNEFFVCSSLLQFSLSRSLILSYTFVNCNIQPTVSKLSSKIYITIGGGRGCKINLYGILLFTSPVLQILPPPTVVLLKTILIKMVRALKGGKHSVISQYQLK